MISPGVDKGFISLGKVSIFRRRVLVSVVVVTVVETTMDLDSSASAIVD